MRGGIYTKPSRMTVDTWESGFYYFLVDCYKKEDGPAGDLARAVAEDKNFPRRSHNRVFIQGYLEKADYDQYQIDAFDELFDLYLDEMYQMAKEDEDE